MLNLATAALISYVLIDFQSHVYIIGDASTGIQYNDGHITLVVTPEQVKG